MDADDRLENEDIQRLQSLFRTLNRSRCAYTMRTACKMAPEQGATFVLSHPRLFRADAKLSWRYRVHEQIMPSLEQLGYKMSWSEVQISHEGYVDAAVLHRKVNRDLQLLLLDYLVFPHDPCVLFHLGKAYARLRNLPQALAYMLRSLHFASSEAEWVARLYRDIIGIMITLGRKKEALDMTVQALSFYDSNPELLLRHSELIAEMGDFPAAERSILRLLGLSQHEYLKNDLPVDDMRRQARRMLGSLQLNQNRLDEAEHLFQQMIAEQPLDSDAWVMLGYVYLQKRYWQRAESIARQLRKLPRGEALAHCIRAEISRILGNHQEARTLADQAIAVAPNLPLARFILAEVLDAMGADIDQRRRALSEILRIVPGHCSVRQALDTLNRSAKTLDSCSFSGVAVASTFRM